MDSDTTHIRKYLDSRDQKKWGFVIFRCTYADDAAWNNFLQILNSNTQLCLEDDNEPEMLGRLDWVIIEDKEALDNASIDTVRQ